jgi:hypothetical protein
VPPSVAFQKDELVSSSVIVQFNRRRDVPAFTWLTALLVWAPLFVSSMIFTAAQRGGAPVVRGARCDEPL